MMKIKIEIDENTLKELVHNHLCNTLGFTPDPTKIKIETKSKQNYKSEWETAAYRAVYEQ